MHERPRFRDADGLFRPLRSLEETERTDRYRYQANEEAHAEMHRRVTNIDRMVNTGLNNAKRKALAEEDLTHSKLFRLANKAIAERAELLKMVRLSLRSAHDALQEGILATRRLGLGDRLVSVPLPAVAPGSAVSVGVMIPGFTCRVTGISVAYLTKPSSALGTIVLDVNKVSGGTTTLLQATASFDLEALTDEESADVAVDPAARDLVSGDYVYATITSDNADAADGTAGVLVVKYNILK